MNCFGNERPWLTALRASGIGPDREANALHHHSLHLSRPRTDSFSNDESVLHRWTQAFDLALPCSMAAERIGGLSVCQAVRVTKLLSAKPQTMQKVLATTCK